MVRDPTSAPTLASATNSSTATNGTSISTMIARGMPGASMVAGMTPSPIQGVRPAPRPRPAPAITT
jgi:hypothetical protein